MSVTIYTTGSAEFLEMMLNGSAMITGSGTTEDLARIGIMIGLLLLAFQAVFNNQGIAFQKAGVVLALYLLFYGPTTTTVIEDTTAGQVRVVDNVPLGPAAIGWVISSVSYEITKITEQAYSTPTMTEYGLFSSLNTIARVRDALRDPMALDSFANRPGWDLPKSLQEYMTFCLLNPIALRNYTSIPELYRKSSYAELMQTPLQSQYMYVYNPNPQLVSCTQGHQLLIPQLNQAFVDVFDDILNKGFAPERASGKVTSPYQVLAALNDSIQSMAISAKNAQEYVQTATVMPIFNNARVDALNHWQEKNSALALRQALNQQELQWAAKGDMFKHYMRPMIAFFEGMLYAMTPFMAFALLLGGPGLKVMGKYLILPIAVGLWMPLLSVVNAFTLWYAGAEVGAILNRFDATGQGFAMLQVLEMDQAISKALGIGGLLAASVPPLALFIVSGSAMVANGIMSQTSQASTFKPQDIMPDAKKQAAVLETTSAYTSDNIGVGATRTGFNNLTESFSGSQMSSALVQSTSTAAETATSQYQESLKAAGMQMSQTGTGREALAQIGSTLAAGFIQGNNSSYTDSREALRSLGISESSINEATANASLGLSTPFGGMKRSDGSSASTMTGQDRSKAEKALAQLTESVQSTDTDTLTFATGDAFKSSALAQVSATNTDEIAQNRAKALQAQEVYQKAKSDQDSIGAMQSLTLRESSLQSLKKGGQGRDEASFALANMAMSTETGRELYNKAFNNEDIRELSTDMAERRAMAATRALNQDGRLGELLSSQYSPLDFEWSPIDSNANSHLVDKAARANQGMEELQDKFEAKRSSNAERFTDTDTMNRDGYHETKSSGAQEVADKVAANNAKVINNVGENHDKVDSLAANNITERFQEIGAASKHVDFSRIPAGISSTLSGALNTLTGDSREAYQDSYERGIALGLNDVQANAFAISETGKVGIDPGLGASVPPEVMAKHAVYEDAYERSGGDHLYARGVAETVWNAGTNGKNVASNADLQLVAESNRLTTGGHKPSRPSAMSNEDVPSLPWR